MDDEPKDIIAARLWNARHHDLDEKDQLENLRRAAGSAQLETCDRDEDGAEEPDAVLTRTEGFLAPRGTPGEVA